MKETDRFRILSYPLILLLLVLALVETWALVRRPWQVDAVIGGADSALLGSGFYTKETSKAGTPFRWTSGDGRMYLPWTQPGYRLILRLDTAVALTRTLEFVGCGSAILKVEVQPGPHDYQLAWSPQCQRSWPEGFGAVDLRLVSEASYLLKKDERELGVLVNELHVRGLGTGPFSVVPLLIVATGVAALVVLLRPWQGLLRLLILAGAAGALPLLFDLLVWHPPAGTSYTWLPATWLPELVVLALIGLVLVRVVVPSRYGPLVAVILVGLLLVALLINLRGHWSVEGPDYGWHLNHGGSWERVLRSHGFYPFGFPLVLWLGQLLWNQPLAMGQTACLVATVIGFAATAALAWRLTNREGAWLGGLLFLASPFLIAYGVLANTDALLMAPTVLALLVLCWSERLRIRHLLLAGLLLGIAYLFRQQALIFVGAAALWLLGVPIGEEELPPRLRWLRRLGRFWPIVMLVAGFLVGSAPQWVLDIRDVGRPFYSTQFVNIWYFAYNRFYVPPAEYDDLWGILNYDPQMLWRHWTTGLRSSLARTVHSLLVWPVGLFGLFGLAWSALDVRNRRYRLLVLWTGVYLLAVTLTVNKERYFLPIVPVLIVLAVIFLTQARERFLSARGVYAFLYPAIQVGLWCWVLLHLVEAENELALYGTVILR